MIALALSLLSLVPQGEDEVLRVVGPRPATVQLGAKAVIDLVVEGRSARPRAPEVPDVPGLAFQVGPRSDRTETRLVGGRMVINRTVSYSVVVEPSRVGQFTIPSIRIYTGSKYQETGELRLEVFKDLGGQELGFLEVTPSATRVYVHEPLSFIVDFGVDDGLQLAQERTGSIRYVDLQVQASWLENFEAGEPLPVPDPQQPANMPLVLNRRLQEVDYEPDYVRGGRTYKRFLFEKAFLPNRLGTFELEAPLLKCSVELDRRRTGFFGEVRGRVEQFYIYGEPLTIEVLGIPEEGRPETYYGSVGRFQVAAALDRQQARVGASVKLTLTITGTGNFEFMRLPELDDLEGFRLLGKTVNNGKNRVDVTYDLTPLDASVTEVPAIHWNYFDTTPGVEDFIEAETDPLPLSVLPLEESETLELLPSTDDTSVIPGVDDIFNIKEDLDLGPVPVVRPRVSSLVIAAVFGPWLLMFVSSLALRFRRRRRADVVGQRSRSAARQFDRRLRSGEDVGDALVAYVAARVGVAEAAVIGPDLAARLEQAGVPTELAQQIQQAVEGGVAARYGGGRGLDAASARELVHRMEDQGNLKAVGATAVMIGLLGLGLPAQGTPDEAYRNGDYAGAAAGYEQLVEQPDADRRLFYNLGNAYFRQGKLPQALWAYERARLAMPRDEQLLANIALVETRLDLSSIEGEPFLDALVALRNSVTPRERLLLCGLFNLFAAGFLLLAWGRRGLRTAGFVLLLPAAILAADVLFVEPAQLPKGIVLEDRVALVSEPRMGLEPVLTLRGGVSLAVLAEGPAWTQVEVRGRSGYLPAEAVGVVR